MKFGGKSLTTRNTKVVSFKRGDETINLIVASVPRVFWDEMKSKGAYSYVKPPEKPVVLRPGVYDVDKATGMTKFKADFDDPTYIVESRKANFRYGALRVWHGLRLDPNVEWETKAPSNDAPKEEWEKFADALSAEITDPVTGFEDGELEEIGKGIEACDLVTAAVVTEEEAIKNFL